jgi:ubiquinol oxidase
MIKYTKLYTLIARATSFNAHFMINKSANVKPNLFKPLFQYKHYSTTTTANVTVQPQVIQVDEPILTETKRPMTEQEVLEHYLASHIPLAHNALRPYGAPFNNPAKLEEFGVQRHKIPVNFADKLALGIMRSLRVFTHGFFGNRYAHHATVLETVAAVPGMVAGAMRHFKSLRTMTRDYGKIGALLEEAENERMHLLTWMQYCQPTMIERMLVVAAQVGYTTAYTVCYILSPRFAHRLVGYLEEEAVEAYTLFLNAIDNGEIPNGPAPEIAKRYYNLGPDATIRDVVLMVRADETMHRDYNHQLADKARHGLH